MKKMLVLLTLIVAVMGGNVLAQSTLQAGDIAIVGMNVDTPDAFAFVFLVPVQAGTQIIFTDCGWKTAPIDSFRTGEGAVVYTAPSALTAGTVVLYDSSIVMPDFVKYATGTIIIGSFQLATAGDQIIAFQGTDIAPSMLYAINDNDTLGVAWNTTAYSSNSSGLPLGLVDGTSAMAYMPETDNIVYIGITSGTKAELLAAISNPANWTGSDATRQTMPAGPFTVTGIEGQPSANDLPAIFALKASPNPAGRSSRISFSLPTASVVELSIFNIAGQKVATLASGTMTAGAHTVEWRAGNVPNGVYFYQLQTGGRSVSQKIVVLK